MTIQAGQATVVAGEIEFPMSQAPYLVPANTHTEEQDGGMEGR